MKPSITIQDSERMTVLIYILKSMFEHSDKRPAAARALATLKGELAIAVGSMEVGVVFARGSVTIMPYFPPKPDAMVRGTVASLVALTRRKGLVSAVLRGQLWAWGNPLFLWKMLPLFTITD